VHVKRADALEHRLHQSSFLRDRQPSPVGTSETDESDERARSNNPVCRGRLPRQTRHGHTGTKENAASTGDARILHHFTHPRMPARGHGN
jgi:hypothetical protein